MDNKDATIGEGGHLRREMDSLDDFEHLDDDSSPLKESKARAEVIDKGDESIAANKTPQPELSAFDPLKMDSNLLEMGDFPEPKDTKLEHFLQDFTPPLKQDLPEIQNKDATQNLLDFERGGNDLAPPKSDLLEKYSDSENEEEFKPSKNDDFQKDFKDVQPEVPQRDYPQEVPAPVVLEAPKTPEPVKKLPEVTTPTVPAKKEVQKIDAEAIFCRMGLDTWFNPERLNPKVESLIYWRDPKRSGPVFGGVLVVLLALTYFSLISVVAYLSLLGLTGTISFRIYKNIVQAVQKTGDGHPFKDLLELDVSLSQDKVKEVSEVAVAHLNAAVAELRRLFLVEDLVDSIKFGVLLWTLTYLGSWFNGMTLIIIAWVALFSLPKVYETNKTQIDANLEIVRTKLAEITSKVKAAIPIGKKAEEKKEQ